MRLLTITIFILSVIVARSFAQEDTARRYKFTRYRETAIKLLVGGSLQQAKHTNEEEYSRKYVEVGLHKSITDFDTHHPATLWTHGLSVEISPAKKTIIGFKYGTWVSALARCLRTTWSVLYRL